MNRISKAAVLATLAFASLEAQPLYVSFEEDFNRAGPGGGFGDYISDGDALNWTTGTVFMRNAKLLAAFQRPDTCDLGLDALDVIDDATATTLVAFSTELPSINGTVLPGDMLATNGAVIPNAALFAAFNPPVPRCEYGLDALQFIGKQADIHRFLTFIVSNPVPPAQVPGLMRQFLVDLWFSTEGTCDEPAAGGPPRFLDGDVLSVVGGGIVIPQSALMAATPAPGIPGLDRGCDGLIAPRNGDRTQTHFSTEITNINPLLTDADVIRIGAAAPTLNYGAVSLPFAPPARFLGLDAMSYYR